ncbi:MAG: TnpV protein [Muricomes sp.]
MKNITYSRQGDYQLPDVTVPKEPEVHLGKYASLRRNYLKEHRYGMFLNLLTQGRLNQHLIEMQTEAVNLMEQLTIQMMEEQKVTEQLKAENQMLWVGIMNNIRSSAEETVMRELIYS